MTPDYVKVIRELQQQVELSKAIIEMERAHSAILLEALRGMVCTCKLQNTGTPNYESSGVMPFLGGTEIALCPRCKALTDYASSRG